MRKESISLFVPGRLCLFGEHSDWAGMYRLMNSAIEPGRAIVTGIEEGISANAVPSKRFRVTSSAPELARFWTDFDAPLDVGALKTIAQSGTFFAHAAGTASYMLEHYRVGGVDIHLTGMPLPLKKGLSSSAAICVLIVRAFNKLFHLKMTIPEEMEAAFRGEERTTSRCGRLDQACAFGVRPVLMTFDGDRVEASPLRVGGEFRFVFADLNAGKNTIKILSDLSRAYPFPETKADRELHQALGVENLRITEKAIEFIRTGDARRLGALMTKSQKLFDKKIAPHSPDELRSPRLHAVLDDPIVQRLSWGGKGVGSHGDGAVQFLAKDAASQRELKERLLALGTRPYKLTLTPSRSIRKAVIPVAGVAARLYPASRGVRKEFFPIVDRDGLAKPAILILLEELLESGIEEICLVLASEEDRTVYKRFFAPTSTELLEKLSPEARKTAARIEEIGKRLRFAYQSVRRGFGDAVFRARTFADGKPILLLLGDTIYRSKNGVPCAEQLIAAYEKTGKTTIAIEPCSPKQAQRCGMVAGDWLDKAGTILNVTKIAEKPGAAYARREMAVRCGNGKYSCYAIFGQYILTAAFYEELEKSLAAEPKGEVDLTGALDAIRRKEGLLGFVPKGESFDLGTPTTYHETLRRWLK
jgi:UTP-glucose-1-phosphate uridylyltransferase/galactokinase